MESRYSLHICLIYVLLDSENIVNMVFKEAILQEKSECVEFLLECGVSAVEDLDMLKLYEEVSKSSSYAKD